MAIEIEVDLPEDIYHALVAYAHNNEMTVEQAATALVEEELGRWDYLAT